MIRVWVYDTLKGSTPLRTLLGYTALEMATQVMPRESQQVVPKKPFIIYGLGNNTNEGLSEDPGHKADRQFFQIWIHDEGGDFARIDSGVEIIKTLFQNAFHVPSMVSHTNWLETSQEFSNETYGSIFRYIRFQAIVSKGVAT
jgi:hypothetical protein